MLCKVPGLTIVPILLLGISSHSVAQDSAAAGEEFFEKQIRPLLIAHCLGCHGDEEQEGGLRLDSDASLRKGGDTGPAVVPGQPAESLLLLAVEYLDEPKMPPSGKLADAEIEKLRRWIALGAPWPAMGPPNGATGDEAGEERAEDKQASAQQWWAFQPLEDHRPPAVRDRSWPRNEIDPFILAELEARQMQPAAPAERHIWLRRATFDLTGLPPTPEEIDALLADESAQAFEKVVDRLLASPAYAQRWARHWLDVARYADYYDPNPQTRTASCELTEAWRYRDWVVESFNDDMPFDHFIVHQIAGDLLPSPTGAEVYPAGLIATTFLTNGVWDRGDADKEKIVSDMVDDNIDVIGKAFLGLTLGCARCHDHKFDPVSTEDYYGLAGIFYSSHFLQDLGAKGGEYTMNRVPLVPRAVLERREQQLAALSELKMQLGELDKRSPPPPADDPERQQLVAQLDQLQQELLPEPPLAMAMQEGGTPGGLFPSIQDVPIHIRGSYSRQGPVVPRRMPSFFSGPNQPPITAGSGRRELAQWVTSAENPLTARVIVNRVWQWHFGEGLVRTPSNFGMTAEPPSHPELLDYLAVRFVEEGWSLKKLHRRIMLSATYRQASIARRELIAADPENRWLGRFAARRLEAEAIRDAMLSVSGGLAPAAGGPADAELSSRRSLYVQTTRWGRSNFATLFDAANPDASTEARVVSTVAPQALYLLNNPFTHSRASELAERLIREIPGGTPNAEILRIRLAYRLLFSRLPSEEEVAVAEQLLKSDAPNAPAGWMDLAHVLLCSNEFVYID